MRRFRQVEAHSKPALALTAGFVLALTGVSATWSSGAWSQETGASPATTTKPDAELRTKLDTNKQELEAKEAKAASIKDDVAKLTSEREKLNTRLLETSALIQKSEAQMSAIEGRVGELEAQEKLVRGSLSQRHGHIAKLLAAQINAQF